MIQENTDDIRNIQNIQDNLRFGLESMTKEIRTGKNFLPAGGNAPAYTALTFVRSDGAPITYCVAGQAQIDSSAIPQASVVNLTTDLASLAAAIGSGSPGAQGTYLVSGCGVIWSGSGYVYNVSACSYYIQGTLYTSPAVNVTLDAAHYAQFAFSQMTNERAVWMADQMMRKVQEKQA